MISTQQQARELTRKIHAWCWQYDDNRYREIGIRDSIRHIERRRGASPITLRYSQCTDLINELHDQLLKGVACSHVESTS